MKWEGIQVERYTFLKFGEGVLSTFVRVVSLILGASGLLGVIINPFYSLSSLLLSICLLMLSLGLIAWSWQAYVSYLKRNPSYLIDKPTLARNPLNGLDFESLEIIKRYRSSPTWRGWAQALEESVALSVPVFRLGLPFKNLLEHWPSDKNESQIDELIRQQVAKTGEQLVNPFDLFLATLGYAPKQLFDQSNITSDQTKKLINFYREKYIVVEQLQKDRYHYYTRTGGFAKEWATSYTNLLDSLTSEITPMIEKHTMLMPLYSRSHVIDQIVSEMTKSTGGNILLIGQSGIGKKEIFYHLASRLLTYKTKTGLDGRQIRVLDVERLLTAATDFNGLQKLTDRLFAEISRAGNVILFIDEIELLLNPEGTLGTANTTNLLESFLSDGNIRVIGTIPTESYITLVRPNPVLSKHFSAIEIPPLIGDDLTNVLLNNLPQIENRYHVFFVLAALEEIISLAHRYLRDEASPAREISLIEETAAEASSNGQTIMTIELVRSVVERKAKVTIQVGETQRQTLLNLEVKLHERIIGQNRAVKNVSDALLRARAGLTTGEKPIGSFLFLGPTGVGKTETAKALAKIYFGSAEQMVRLDMTEYADASGLQKLLGVDQTNRPGALTVAIQNRPSSVLLLDEIEKSSLEVKNVFLQLLDEGRLTTNYGKVLDFTNTIIIATSNAGSDFIKQQVSRGITTAAFEKQLIDQLITEKIFLPEFLNRFDAVVVYSPLDQTEITQVVKLRLGELNAHLVAEKKLNLKISDEVIKELVQRGYDPVFGARALDRVIKSDLETAIAREIITQQPVAGSEIVVDKL